MHCLYNLQNKGELEFELNQTCCYQTTVADSLANILLICYNRSTKLIISEYFANT